MLPTYSEALNLTTSKYPQQGKACQKILPFILKEDQKPHFHYRAMSPRAWTTSYTNKDKDIVLNLVQNQGIIVELWLCSHLHHNTQNKFILQTYNIQLTVVLKENQLGNHHARDLSTNSLTSNTKSAAAIPILFKQMFGLNDKATKLQTLRNQERQSIGNFFYFIYYDPTDTNAWCQRW